MHKYFPAFITKRAELKSLRKLTPEVKANISPVLEIIPDGMSLSDLVESLKTHWNQPNHQILIDFSNPELKESNEDLYNLFRALIKVYKINALPVFTPNMSKERKELFKTLTTNKIKVAFRAKLYESNEKEVLSDFDEFLKEYKTPIDKVLLIVDCGHITAIEVLSYEYTVPRLIKEIDNAEKLIEVAVISGVFPRDLNEFTDRPEPHLLERLEQKLFNSIQEKSHLNIRYGDYGIRHPYHFPQSGKDAPTPSCSIKYSTESNYIIYRGKKSENHELGTGQYIEHSINLVNSQYFPGKSFCWGDKEILKISKFQIGPDSSAGGSEKWINISLSHHITLMSQIQ
ncbi:beta family protein [Roseivirga thermotolerans]|uniref:Beta protein n=1 Tax=Roseivirga thermotolerans TaxID=1758176 RepID=A0ABQ3I3X9_9BACT|nr:beta family protein [Roseivirga thermotolerans]GHE52238.1 hypothetical protein GCM10011340_03090 [Roseivirga thermotolerans]